MPIYTIRNKKTNESQEVNCSYDDLQQMLHADPEITRELVPPKIVSGTGGVLSKTDDGWKDNLKRIKSNSGRGNTIKV